jgi:hypothetical protein
MRAKFLYLIYLLSVSGMLTAQDVGLRPVEIGKLKTACFHYRGQQPVETI